jgi:hypothetical protein
LPPSRRHQLASSGYSVRQVGQRFMRDRIVPRAVERG